MGIYNGQPIRFNIKSNEFKFLVQSGEVEFKNGSSIKCSLQIEREIGNEGLEKVLSYNVTRVDKYFQNNQPIETKEGKLHRQKRSDTNQLEISFNSGHE